MAQVSALRVEGTTGRMLFVPVQLLRSFTAAAFGSRWTGLVQASRMQGSPEQIYITKHGLPAPIRCLAGPRWHMDDGQPWQDVLEAATTIRTAKLLSRPQREAAHPLSSADSAPQCRVPIYRWPTLCFRSFILYKASMSSVHSILADAVIAHWFLSHG